MTASRKKAEKLLAEINLGYDELFKNSKGDWEWECYNTETWGKILPNGAVSRFDPSTDTHDLIN